MQGSHQVVDTRTGEVLITVIALWGPGPEECPMCGEIRRLDHAVGWYCGPTQDEIGSVSTEYRGGDDGTLAIVGGMTVCQSCHDGHYAKGNGNGG